MGSEFPDPVTVLAPDEALALRALAEQRARESTDVRGAHQYEALAERYLERWRVLMHAANPSIERWRKLNP